MICISSIFRQRTFLVTVAFSLLAVVLMPSFAPTLRSLSTILTRRFSASAMAAADGTDIRPPAEPYSMAFVTAPNKDVAKTLASGIVSKKLAACVNIIPGLVSVYEWEGKINTDDEVLMMIKTRTSRVDELTEFVKSNHPYEVCEVITTSIEKGNRAYLDWIGKTVPEKSDP